MTKPIKNYDSNQQSKAMKLLDDDGENGAVRWFLACYGGGGSKTIGAMKAHLEMSGFDGCWPDWCNTEHPSAHLTKGGAQLWIQHLFSLEAQQVAVPQAIEDLAGVTVCCGDFAKCHRPCTPRGQWMATEAQQVAVPTGCHRSHPHEEMNEVCQLKTEIAQLKAVARQEPSTAMMYKISTARSVYRDYKDVQCAFDYLEALIAADPPDSTPTDWSAV